MLRFLQLAVSTLFLTQFLWAQFGSGIQGTVTDRSSAVMPGARILVTNLDTGVTREVVSSEIGLYRVPSLNPGTYKITATKPGFVGAQQDSVVLAVDEVRKVDFTLEVGNLIENVTVHDQPTILETEEGRISGTLNRVQLTQLPIPNRNVYNLLALQPGVTGRSLGTDNVSGRSAANVNANGTRVDANSYTMDNMSTNSTSRGGSAEVTPNLDSVEEVRVVTNNFSAEEGRNMGAHISVISKAGTNQLHGSLWDYFQNNTLSARNFFDTTVPVFRRNQYGYSVGGPIVKNRTFFFTTFEGLRQSGGRTTTATVETPEFRDFLLRTRPNSIAAKIFGDFHPTAYPTSNIRDLGSPQPGVNKFSSTPDGIPDIGTAQYIPRLSSNESDQFTARFDHELRPGKDRLYFYYYHFDGVSKTDPIRPQFIRNNPTTGNFGNFNETHIFSPTTLNELRLGVVRYTGVYSDLLHKEVPELVITGFSTIRDVNVFPGGWFPTEYMVKDTLSSIHGNHGLKFGGEIRRTHNNIKHTRNYIPAYTFASILDFADDEALQMARTVDPRTGEPAITDCAMRIWEAGLFVQDDWKLRRNLTINLGLRYEYFGPFTDSNNRLRNFVLGPGATFQQQIANGKVDVVGQSWNTDTLNFAPRFGFAWDIGGKGKNVIRGGYGISYDRLATVFPAGYRDNPPLTGIVNVGSQFGTSFTYTLGDEKKAYYGYPVDPGLRAGLDEHNGIKGIKVTSVAVSRTFNNPYTHNWFFGVQRSLPGQMVLEASYIGSAGHHLVNTANVNRFSGDLLDGVLNGLNPSFSSVSMSQTTSNSIYHGGTASVRRQFSRGFMVQGAYTYGKVITDAEAEQDVTLYYDVNNRNLDRSLASFDVPQRLALMGLWDLPFLRGCSSWACKAAGGWQLSGYSVLEKGNPLNIITSAAYPRGDFNADGVNSDRPNAPADSVARQGFTKDQFLNGIFKVSDFPLPASGQIGNLGRNTFRGPGFARVDFSMTKNMRFTERLNARFRMEAFNAFNRVSLNAPSGDLNSNNFGKSTGAQVPRSYQASLQLRF
jgi:hypothetical protein